MGSSNNNMHRDVGGQRRKEIKKSKVKNTQVDKKFNLKRGEELKAKYNSKAAPGETTLMEKVDNLRKGLGQESLMRKKREFLEKVREYAASLVFHFHIIITVLMSLSQGSYTQVEKDMMFNHAHLAVMMIAAIAILYVVDLFSFELAHSQLLSSEVTYEQIMKDHFHVKVTGHSGVAQLISSLVRHLDVDKDIHRFIHTDKCRP
ncbi:hypothetical protein Pcinc_027424 [Petrolisthes cinctipes]|uniref:Dendritic cell-specific transmembrane protein-like domain-containing protein n=1 Tax=Petrolisthes cinctipes TaxID=88211 RepID=A0AAE1F554_PETCI|nr:hypothetical protein Pcinc_027424 [Petrolisthes cinctipes]